MPRIIRRCHAFMVKNRFTVSVVLILACAGCRASASGSASASASASTSGGAQAAGTGEGELSAAKENPDAKGASGEEEKPVHFDAAHEQSVVGPQAIGGGSSDEPSSWRISNAALLGARHDLRISADRLAPSCTCLAVVVGQSNDARLSWQSGAPSTDPGTQLVIALSSQGEPCQREPEGSLGASYWGYKWSGNDVIVFVESARHGRPVTRGAIIPKPTGEGQVYVQATGPHVPYGRPLSGKGKRCKVGNPGPPRTAPPTPDEEKNLEIPEE
ncbi:MAG TPA: hypothetical protein VGJ84_03335 [Polyangiaceae bacterium]